VRHSPLPIALSLKFGQSWSTLELTSMDHAGRRILRHILGRRFNLVLGTGSRNWTYAARNPWINGSAETSDTVWLMEALAEETWRVAAIVGLVAAQISPPFSIAAVAVAFGSAYLRLGLQRAAVATLDGVFFGFLFLWQGSFLAPFTAHLAVHAVYLWGVGQSQDRESRKTWQMPGTKCPVCQRNLKLLQVKMSDVFECPSCKASLSVSDGYQNVMRFTAAFSFCSLTVLTILLLKD
jgi:hypothetical protein